MLVPGVDLDISDDLAMVVSEVIDSTELVKMEDYIFRVVKVDATCGIA